MDSSDSNTSDDSNVEILELEPEPPRLRPRIPLPPASLQAQSYSCALAAKFVIDKPGPLCSKRASVVRKNFEKYTLPDWWPSYAVITHYAAIPPVMNACRYQIVHAFLKEQLNSSKPLEYGPVGGVQWQEEIVLRLKRLRGSSGNILGRDVLYWIRTSDLIDLFRRICLRSQELGSGKGQNEVSPSIASAPSIASKLRSSRKPQASVEVPGNDQPTAEPSQDILRFNSPQVRPVKKSLVAAENDETEWPTLLHSMNMTRHRASRTVTLPRVVTEEPSIGVPNKSPPTIVKAALLPTPSAPQIQSGAGGVQAQEPHMLTLENGSLVFQVPADVVPGTFYMLTPKSYSIAAYNPIILPPAVDLPMNANHEVNHGDANGQAGQDEVPANQAARQESQDENPEVPAKKKKIE